MTVQRLLDAAAREFARRGFVSARVRDIVDNAGVNLAAVNYHFGGKEGLYRATVAMLAKQAQEGVPPTDTPALRAMAPEEQLRAVVRVLLVHCLEGGHALSIGRILAHELLDPTPAFEAILRDAPGPHWARLEEIVAALLGPRATRAHVSLASLSVVGQWVLFLFGRRLLAPQLSAIAGNPAQVEQLADQVADFSIAAIRANRLRLESGLVPESELPHTGHEGRFRDGRAGMSLST